MLRKKLKFKLEEKSEDFIVGFGVEYFILDIEFGKEEFWVLIKKFIFG